MTRLPGWWSVEDGWWLDINGWRDSKVGWEVLGRMESWILVAGIYCSSGMVPLSFVVVERRC